MPGNEALVWFRFDSIQFKYTQRRDRCEIKIDIVTIMKRRVRCGLFLLPANF